MAHQVVFHLLVVETSPVIWGLGIFAIILALILVFTRKERCLKASEKGCRCRHQPQLDEEDYDRERSENRVLKDNGISIPSIPIALSGAVPSWMILDLQTTGLSTKSGFEDHIVEASWLLLDEKYHEISRHTVWVKQDSLGGDEARSIHEVSEETLAKCGISERAFLEIFFQELPDKITLVMHNVAFDLPILRSTILRVMPESVERIDACPTFCTMKYLVEEKECLEYYPRLLQLSEYLLAITPTEFYSIRPVSLRNVYYTWQCFVALRAME